MPIERMARTQVSWLGVALASIPVILALGSLTFYAGGLAKELTIAKSLADRNEQKINRVLEVTAGTAAEVKAINKAIVNMEKKIATGVLPTAKRAIQEHERRMDRLENKLDVHRHGGGPSSLER